MKTRIEIKYVRTTKNEHEVHASYELFNPFLDPGSISFATLWWSTGPTILSHTGHYFVNKSKDNRLSECNFLKPECKFSLTAKWRPAAGTTIEIFLTAVSATSMKRALSRCGGANGGDILGPS